ncbi:response regulator transcription factor [Aerococcaceae bacterium NML171108]|nr:response regulator transcription factor [Aerococcaceae bacterium NML171108]
MIRLLIVDDEKLIRTGLQIMLETFADVQVVGLAENGRQAYEQCCQQHVDAVLMDIRMPETDGIEGTRLIKEQFPHIAILILTTFQDSDYTTQAMQCGASGYLLKDSSHEAIYDGIKVALSGKIVMDSTVSEQLLGQLSTSQQGLQKERLQQHALTDKELQLIQLISSGLNNKEIAQTLFLSEGTVKNNVSQLLFKLDLRDRTQLVIFAYENGLNK